MLDVVVANQRGPLLVYRNDVAPGHDWIEFDLEGGCRPETPASQRCSNRSAIGAQVTLHWNGQEQLQEVSGGSGFSAQNQRRLHFGLGKRPKVEQAVIRWPSGKMQTIEHPAPGRCTWWRNPHDARARLAAPPAPQDTCRVQLDNRYLAPFLVTCILLAGQVTFGFLES